MNIRKRFVWIPVFLTGGALLPILFDSSIGTRSDGSDHLGNLNQKPLKIASSTVAGDEILFLILQEADALQRLRGLSSLVDNSEYSHLHQQSELPKLRIGSDLEGLLRAKLDLVVMASFNRPNLVHQIEQLGSKVLMLGDFRGIDDIKSAVSGIGIAIGEARAAEIVVKKFSEALAKIEVNAKARSSGNGYRPKVLGLNLDATAFASKTIFDEIIEVVGGVNALRGLGLNSWPKLGHETLLRLDPDLIVVPGAEKEERQMLDYLKSNPSTKRWHAVTNNRIASIKSADLNAASPYVTNAAQDLYVKLGIYFE